MSRTPTELIEGVVKKFPKQLRPDLYQECFIYLSDNPEASNEDLINCCRRFLRLLRTSTKYVSLDKPITVAEETTTYLELLPSDTDLNYQIDCNSEIERLLKRLKPQHQTIYRLYFQQDISIKDISEYHCKITGIKSTDHLYTIIKQIKHSI